MKSKQFFPVIAAVLLVLPFHRSLAEGPITFEVVVAFNYPSAKSTVASVITIATR